MVFFLTKPRPAVADPHPKNRVWGLRMLLAVCALIFSTQVVEARLINPTSNLPVASGADEFLSSDPMGIAGGGNLYAYAKGCPTAYIDPLGLCAEGDGSSIRASTWMDSVNGALDYPINVARNLLNMGIAPVENTYNASSTFWNDPTLANGISYGLTTGLGLLGAALPGLAPEADALSLETRAVTEGIAETIANPVPSTVARVIAGEGPFPTLGLPGSADVFVTDAAAIRGLTPAQLGPRLGIPASDTFTVIEFPTPLEGLSTPVFRSNPGFIGRGVTSGGASEFAIPNGPIPPGATTTILRSR